MRDVVFDAAHDLRLDVYSPKNAKAGQYPVLFFIYGGRWTTGVKEDYRFIAGRFVDLGYVVVIADYRKYPDVKFPEFVEDSASALLWTHENIMKYGGDAEQIVVAGHSAGAHMGALLASDERYLKGKVKIQAFAGLAGPYAFTPDEPDLEDMFGPPERYAQMQVPTFIDGKEPPMLLLYGAQDDVVAAFNYERLEAAIKGKGGQVSSIVYPEYGHVGLLLSLSWVKDDEKRVAGDMDSFFKNALSKPKKNIAK